MLTPIDKSSNAFGCTVANCFKANTKQLFSDILCSNLKLLSVINNEQGFNVVVDSPCLVKPPHFSYIFLKLQQIGILPITRYQHNGFACGIHEKSFLQASLNTSSILTGTHGVGVVKGHLPPAVSIWFGHPSKQSDSHQSLHRMIGFVTDRTCGITFLRSNVFHFFLDSQN